MAIRDDVQLLIPDVDGEVFTDEQVDQFIALAGDNALLAAALAVEVIATNEALVFKYVRTNDLTVDGTKVADVLLDRAKVLREQAISGATDDFVVVYPFPTAIPGVVPEATARTWPLWH